MNDFKSEHLIFKRLLEKQDASLLLKANKTTLVEHEISVRKNYAKRIEFEVVTDQHGERIYETEIEVDKFNSKLDDLKYTLIHEINNSVRRAFLKLNNDQFGEVKPVSVVKTVSSKHRNS